MRDYAWLQWAKEEEINYFKVCELSGISAVSQCESADGYYLKTTVCVFVGTM